MEVAQKCLIIHAAAIGDEPARSGAVIADSTCPSKRSERSIGTIARTVCGAVTSTTRPATEHPIAVR
jgi:hypothetical protein